jgi:hypothetical protein
MPRRAPCTAADWFKGAAFHQEVPFDIAGRHFLLALRSVGHRRFHDPLVCSGRRLPAGDRLTALLAQNMGTTILRKRLVERAVVIARTAQLRAANETLRDEVEQRRQAEAELRIAQATRRKAPAAPNPSSWPP